MLSVNGKSHVIHHVLTQQILGAPKKLRFQQNFDKMLNWLNFASYTKATCRGHGLRLRARVMCRGHVQGACAKGMQIAWSNLHLEIGGVIMVHTLWIKYRCQLVIRLKAIKYKKDISCYLFSSINLLDHRIFRLALAAANPLTSNLYNLRPPISSQAFVMMFWQYNLS